MERFVAEYRIRVAPDESLEDKVEALGIPARPLCCTALKPMGLGAGELAALARGFALGGVDLVKDDHGLTDQRTPGGVGGGVRAGCGISHRGEPLPPSGRGPAGGRRARRSAGGTMTDRSRVIRCEEYRYRDRPEIVEEGS